MYYTIFIVKSDAPYESRFPLDMLRYDRCCPSREADSVAIATQGDEVELIQYHKGKTPRITDGRWSSFGWNVMAVGPAHKMEG